MGSVVTSDHDKIHILQSFQCLLHLTVVLCVLWLQFRYATGCEVLLMIIGLLCAALHGIALPLMCVVFGQMTDSFVQSGQQLNLTGTYSV
jgi:hypothetical protein